MPDNILDQLPNRNGFQAVYSAVDRTATPQFTAYSNKYAHGLYLIINVFAVTSTPSVVANITFNAASTFSLLTSVPITAVGLTVLSLYPGFTAVANVTANQSLPDNWIVQMTHGNANSIRYSVDAHLLL